MKKYSILLLSLMASLAYASFGSESESVDESKIVAPTVDTLNYNAFPSSTKRCFGDYGNISYSVKAINNNGELAGSVSSDIIKTNGKYCASQAFTVTSDDGYKIVLVSNDLGDKERAELDSSSATFINSNGVAGVAYQLVSKKEKSSIENLFSIKSLAYFIDSNKNSALAAYQNKLAEDVADINAGSADGKYLIASYGQPLDQYSEIYLLDDKGKYSKVEYTPSDSVHISSISDSGIAVGETKDLKSVAVCNVSTKESKEDTYSTEDTNNADSISTNVNSGSTDEAPECITVSSADTKGVLNFPRISSNGEYIYALSVSIDESSPGKESLEYNIVNINKDTGSYSELLNGYYPYGVLTNDGVVGVERSIGTKDIDRNSGVSGGFYVQVDKNIGHVYNMIDVLDKINTLSTNKINTSLTNSVLGTRLSPNGEYLYIETDTINYKDTSRPLGYIVHFEGGIRNFLESQNVLYTTVTN